MTRYSHIAIIYNPNSTGSSESYARTLYEKFQFELPNQQCSLVATKHAGHAEELAYSLAKKHATPLIISSSGDGGYHEVVNGALRAQKEGAEPTTGLLPAGNANDHHRNVHNSSFFDSIIKSESKQIDVLTLEGLVDNMPVKRYAHSYIGIGLTPRIGEALNKASLNRFNEILIVVRSFFKLTPVSLIYNGKRKKYDSIIFSNIDSMSKYLRISSPSSIRDGKFEVTVFAHRNKFLLLATLIKTVITGIREDSQSSHFEIKTVKKTILQADGETITLDADSLITVSIEKQLLRSII